MYTLGFFIFGVSRMIIAPFFDLSVCFYSLFKEFLT